MPSMPAKTAIAWRYAPSHAAWAFAVAASVRVNPRLLIFQVSTLLAAMRDPAGVAKPDVAVLPGDERK